MADPLGNFVPEFIENEVEREAIVKLAKMITDRVPQKLGMKKITKYDPEYWGLSAMCTDEMAEIALKMGVRKPKTLDQMVKLTGIEKKHLEEVLQQMAVNGVIEYNWENPQHEKQYVLPMFVPGSAEFGNMNLQMLEEHPEVGRFFERMSRLPLEKVTPMVPEGGAGIGMHVIPVEKAISMENQSISIEHISHWLDKYEGKYAASPCSCRRSPPVFPSFFLFCEFFHIRPQLIWKVCRNPNLKNCGLGSIVLLLFGRGLRTAPHYGKWGKDVHPGRSCLLFYPGTAKIRGKGLRQ